MCHIISPILRGYHRMKIRIIIHSYHIHIQYLILTLMNNSTHYIPNINYFYDPAWFAGHLKRSKVTNWCIAFDQNAISWPIVRSFNVRHQKNHDECSFNFHFDFVPYRPYRVLKNNQKSMFWMQFYMLFLIWAFF